MTMSVHNRPNLRAQTAIKAAPKSRKRGGIWLALASALLLLTTAPCFSQATGTIEGLVTDKTGAAIPQAQITVTDQATNQVRKVVADSAGEFTATLLPSGTYSVLVERAGFASSLRKDIVISANTTVQANAQLEIASVTQQVSVTAGAQMIQTTSTNLVQVVDSRRIEDLPLNGRNVLDLMDINAGVSTAGATGSTSQIQNVGTNVPAAINGARSDATNYLLDNGDNNDLYAKVSLPFPNPDAVQEVSIQTATYDAQYGRAGGVVNVITKSGGNQWHGSLFEYVRNYQMNAANYFSGLDSLKRNQFGGSLGGPFLIPKIYNGHDRTFFFFGYQGTRQSSATPGVVETTPSQAMKDGDFSAWLQGSKGAVYDPDTGKPFPNNQIPVSRFDPVAVKMLALMPASSASSAYQVRLPSPTNDIYTDEFSGRIDHHLTANQHLFGRVYQWLNNNPWTFSPTELYIVNAGQKAQYRTITLDDTWIISPRWLNEANFTHNIVESDAINPPTLAARSLQGYGARVQVLPNEPTLVANLTGWSGFNIGQGYTQVAKSYEYKDILNFSNGRQNLKIGGSFDRYSLAKTAAFNSGGQITFNGQMDAAKGANNAGNAIADFVLGRASAWIQQSSWAEDLTNNYGALFAEDDWRVTPRLTLNLGLRWNPLTDFVEHMDQKQATFIPGAQSVRFPGAPPGMLYLGDPQIKNHVINPDWKNLAPRIGFAVQAAPETVVRGAYGIFYDITTAETTNRIGSGQPFVDQVSLVGPVQMSNPYNGGPILDPTPFVPTSSFPFSTYGAWAVPSTNMPSAYMQQWDLMVERQFGDTLLRVGYIGSKGTHLMQTANINDAVYGPGATASNINQRRPYQPIGVLALATDSAYSSYNSLQVTAQKRWSRGFSVLGNYTYSRSIDRTSASGAGNASSVGPDPYDYNRNRSVSDFDFTHRAVISGIWQLPSLSAHSAAVRETIGGWQMNYIFGSRSGSPGNIVSGVDNAFSGDSGEFADLTGQPWKLSHSRAKAAQIHEWFNTGAFEVNAVGTVGDGSRNSIREPPSTWNIDYSLFKNFPIEGRLNLQFRAEAFNLLNHTTLGGPNETVNSANFGTISTASDPRIMQLALRMTF